MKIVISGALGRMGRELARAAAEAGDCIVCGVDSAWRGQPCDFPMVRTASEITRQAEVLIDFSNASALPGLLDFGTRAKLPLVLCTTGYTPEELATVEQAARSVPILRSANMSLGINVLQQLAALAARALGEGYDVEIIEKHHRQKLDSPSGTALMLYETVAAAKAGTTEPVYGRHGRTAKRTDGEIGLHAVRGGTVTGEHEVGFYGKGEEIILTHRAESRALLAEGALRAARFLLGMPAGLYSMQNVVERMLG